MSWVPPMKKLGIEMRSNTVPCSFVVGIQVAVVAHRAEETAVREFVA